MLRQDVLLSAQLCMPTHTQLINGTSAGRVVDGVAGHRPCAAWIKHNQNAAPAAVRCAEAAHWATAWSTKITTSL